jgi:hypothetical protein
MLIQVSSGYVSFVQVNSGEVWLGQVISGYNRLFQVRQVVIFGQVRSE